jgi:hypothetical protein
MSPRATSAATTVALIARAKNPPNIAPPPTEHQPLVVVLPTKRLQDQLRVHTSKLEFVRLALVIVLLAGLLTAAVYYSDDATPDSHLQHMP